jgi:hypothetical protein
MIDVEKLKEEAFAEALAELREENAKDLDVLKKLERYDDDERKRTKTISK